MLTSKTQITNDAIGTVKISGSFVTLSGNGLIQSRAKILNQYVAEGYQIPQNSFFYKEYRLFAGGQTVDKPLCFLKMGSQGRSPRQGLGAVAPVI